MVKHYFSLIYNVLLYRLSRLFNYPLSLPINVTLSITNKCYSKCKTCNVWKIYKNNPKLADKELTTKEWKKALKSLGKTPIWFTITGGETMLKKDLVEIVSFIVKYNKPRYINIATSGIYPKKTIETIEKILKVLSKHNISLTVNLSIDELGKEYTKVRGVPKGFKKVKQTLLSLKKLKKKYSKLIVGVNVVLSKYNYKRFRDICDYILNELQPDSLVSEIGAKRKSIYFDGDIDIPSDKYIENYDYLLNLETQNNAAKITSFFRKKYYRLVKNQLKFNKEIIKCFAGFASCEISSTGEIRECPVRANSMGNLKKNKFKFSKVWRSNQAKKIRRKIKEEQCFCSTANHSYTNMISNFDLF